jgi:hypothetical protein
LLDAGAEGGVHFGLALGVAEVGIHEGAAIIEDEAFAPPDEAEEADEFVGGLRDGDYVGRVEVLLDALDGGWCDAAKSGLGIRLIFESAFEGVREKEAASLKLGKSGAFVWFCAGAGAEAFGNFVEVHARGGGANTAVLGGVVEKIFDASGRSGIEEQNANDGGEVTPSEIEPLSTARDMGIVRAGAASVANGHCQPSFSGGQW